MSWIILLWYFPAKQWCYTASRRALCFWRIPQDGPALNWFQQIQFQVVSRERYYIYIYVYVSIPKKGESDLPVHPWYFSFALPRSQADKSGHGQIDYDECGNLGDVGPLEPLDHLTDRNLSKSTISEIYRVVCPFKANPGRMNTQLKNSTGCRVQRNGQAFLMGPKSVATQLVIFFAASYLYVKSLVVLLKVLFALRLYFCALCCCILKSTGGGNSSLEPTKRNKAEPHIESE